MRLLSSALLLLALAPLAPAESGTAPATPPAPAAEAPAVTFKPGDAAPAEILPTAWLRGTPVKALAPGVAYVFTSWNTVGGHKYAPGYNISRTLKPFAGNPAVLGVVTLRHDDSPPERLLKRLSYPSQQTPFAIGRATPGAAGDRILDGLYDDKQHGGAGTVIVRDGRIVWIGDGMELQSEELTAFAAPAFNFEQYVAAKAAKDARTKIHITRLMKEIPAARKAGEDQRVESMLADIESDQDLHPFVFSRVCDARCAAALAKGDTAGAIAAMKKLADKYPDESTIQSWVHKIISSTESLTKAGAPLAEQAATRVARLKEGDLARAWWHAAAQLRRASGDKPGALAALIEAEKASEPMTRLASMRAEAAKAAATR